MLLLLLCVVSYRFLDFWQNKKKKKKNGSSPQVTLPKTSFVLLKILKTFFFEIFSLSYEQFTHYLSS